MLVPREGILTPGNGEQDVFDGSHAGNSWCSSLSFLHSSFMTSFTVAVTESVSLDPLQVSLLLMFLNLSRNLCRPFFSLSMHRCH